MKKILIAIGVLYGGGAERVASVWASGLAQKGYEVSLLMYGRGEDEYALHPSVQVHAVAKSYEEYKKLSRFKRLYRMRKIIKVVKPNFVISFLSQMQIWMMFSTFGRKLIRIETVRNNPWESYKTNKRGEFLWKKCFLRANAVILQTQEQAEYFNQKIQRKSVVISNPLAQQYKDNFKTEYAQNITRFVAAGRITPQKNYPLMIKAFQKACESNNDIMLFIYGSGEEEYTQKIQKLINETGLASRIQLMGKTTDMSSVLRSADAFLMTSNFEGMPNALAEAMATGLVCVSTNCRTGPRDLIDDGQNGYLVQVENEEELVKVIKKITKLAQEEIMTIGKCARKKVLELCGEQNSLNKLISLIEGLNK